jgi:hypothetical protein
MSKAPNKSARWTDTDDSIVDLFPVAEAAAILGRTYEGVRSRRAARGLGPRHGNQKPKRRLRREYFSTGQGPREAIEPLPERSCRYCTCQKLHARGLCKKCYRWVQRTVESGYVTWEIAERCWLSGRVLGG